MPVGCMGSVLFALLLSLILAIGLETVCSRRLHNVIPAKLENSGHDGNRVSPQTEVPDLQIPPASLERTDQEEVAQVQQEPQQDEITRDVGAGVTEEKASQAEPANEKEASRPQPAKGQAPGQLSEAAWQAPAPDVKAAEADRVQLLRLSVHARRGHKLFDLDVADSDTMARVKERIREKILATRYMVVPASQMLLFLYPPPTVLEDHRTVSDCGLKEGSEIRVGLPSES